MHVLILGAGLGGLSLAQCLRKQGVSYEIFERDEDASSRSQGWAIAFRGAQMDELISCFPSDMPDFRQSTNHLAPLPLPAQICMYAPGITGKIGVEDTPEQPLIRAERLRLRSWLMSNLTVQWGKHATRIEEHEQGVTVHFKDGSTRKGDFVIGADGVNSIAREHLLQRPNNSVLNAIPLATIIGQVTLSGDAFKRQLNLGHSGYMLMNPLQGFFAFCGLHEPLPDGLSGKYYWVFMKPDPTISEPDHWLQSATQQEKLDHVLKAVAAGQPPEFCELFQATPPDGVREDLHVWRDLELPVGSLPAGRVVLLGDAAHVMVPFRGEGGHHALIDSMKLSKLLTQLYKDGDSPAPEALRAAIDGYNVEMLTRGAEAVRNSRTLQVPQKSEDGKPKVWQGTQPLPDREIVLGISQPVA